MLLINTVYFKSNWAKEFNKNDTKEKTFYMLKGKKKHPMMRQSGKYRYFETDKFQTIALPYRDPAFLSLYANGIFNQNRYCLYIFLPNKNYGINQFCDDFNYEDFRQLMEEYKTLESYEGQITLPKFTFSFQKELKSELSSIGMKEAFDPLKANFNKMTGGQAWIDRVIHQTFIEVNETGTEAAAATKWDAKCRSMFKEIKTPPKPFNMVVDRPFFFVIRDDSTDAILFMGTVMEPQ